MNPPPIQVGATQSTGQYQVSLQGSNLNDLYKYSGLLENRMKTSDGFVDVDTDVALNSPKVWW